MKWIFTMIVILILLSWCCNSCKAQKSTIIYVSYVHDGDTFYDNYGRPYRISEIDCPELGQPYGEEAKRFTDSLINHKYIKVWILGTDVYCRTVCKVAINKTIDLGKLLVSSGYAWVYRRYSSENMWAVYVFAKRKKRGMWASKDNYPPFKYREIR
jgi:micrococcal nuclease